MKWILYLAPLPLTALLALRRPVPVIKLVSYLVPLVALGTLCYSAFRLWQAIGGDIPTSIRMVRPSSLRWGMFAEVWSVDGLSIRADTMSHTAYGMYLGFVLMFSICLALFSGWNGMVSRWYAAGQGVLFGPLAAGGILLSGSRTSVLLLAASFLTLLALLLLNPGNLLPARRRAMCAGMLVLVPLALLFTPLLSTALPTLDRLQETLTDRLEITQNITGAVTPVLPGDALTRQSVRNVQTRLWIWGQTVRHVLHNPGTVLWGIGYDRRRFVETVVGLPYEGPNVNLQTAHNLFLIFSSRAGSATSPARARLCLVVLERSEERTHSGARSGVGGSCRSRLDAHFLLALSP